MVDSFNPEEVFPQIFPETTKPPVMINSSATGEHFASGTRDIVIFIGCFSAVIGFISKHDLAGLVTWLQSSDAFPFIGLLLAGATLAWRHIRIQIKKAQMVYLGRKAPDSVAIVVDTSSKNSS